MLVYWIKPDTKEFAGYGYANESPLEPGVFAIPADATTVAPPTLAAKQAAVFVEGAWAIVPDHRGEVWYRADRLPVTIETLGDPADDGLLEDQPPEPEPEEPDPGTMPPRLVASALNINVANGDVASVEGVFGFAGAVYLGTGLYMLLFLASQPDTNFFSVISGGAPCMLPDEKDVDYVIIRATDAAGGVPVDPSQFSVQVFRV